MTVRVGINGFGRIGRNFFRAVRAPNERPRHRDRRRQRPDRQRHPGPPPQVRLDPRPPRRGRELDQRRDRRRRHRDQGVRRARPRHAQVGRPGRRRRRRVHRVLHRRHQGTCARRRRRREEGHHLRARLQRGHHHRDGRQPRALRRRAAHGDLQRVVHHQLPGPDGQGAQRRSRHQQGPDDHHPRLHRRPEPARQHPQGPASCPGRRAQHRADLDRRREGDRPGAARAQGQARRLRPARPHPDRLAHRPLLRGGA